VDFGTETVCPACGTITKVTVEEPEEIEKFDLVGSNMTLGNELRMNVAVKSSDLGDGTYTAKVTHGDTVTEAAVLPYSDAYHAVSFSVAAKQMADKVTVEIFDENGNAVSNVYETSVRDYAMSLLANQKQPAAVKVVLVDMLNYGAEAQKYFGYNTEDLANGLLTDAQKALATESVTCQNKQVKGKNFYGTNLALEDRILLNMAFGNCQEGYTAKVIFTDYLGAVKTVNKQLAPVSGNIYMVSVDDIVLADAFSPVTVTVYDADGNVHGTATDSVESYIARTNKGEINEAIMKFAYSAREYLS
jgi:hypothetical protein